jgi:outer membrane receptor protein involved in Fe transport
MAETRKNTLIFALLGSSACLLMAAPATAQEAAAPAPQDAAAERTYTSDADIIVTARKRDETLLDVPVAVSALSAADMNRYQANDLTKIGQMVPQVIIAKTGGGGAGASFAIRGVGSSALDSGIEQTVSVNIDGLQVSRGRLATQGFFDVQQVEVLKGPQALFFGKNSPGGVISLRTAGATKSFEGYVRAGYEFNADERYVEGAVSGPISDTLGFRIAGRASKMDGYLTNVAGPLVLPSDPTFIRPGAGDRRSPSNREFLGRLTLEWNPTDAFKAVLKVFGSDLKNNGETANNEVKCNGGSPQTLDIVTGTYVSDPYGDCTLNGVRSSTALPVGRAANYPNSKDGRPFTDYRSILTSLSMDYKLDWATITSVTGYYSYDNGSFDNFDFSAVGTVWGYNQDKSSAFSQEVRLATDFGGKFNVVLGGYFESAKRNTLGNGAIAAVGLDPVTGRYDNWELISENHGKTYSLFGQAIWNILPNLELAGGVRWTRETKEVRVANTYVHSIFATFGIVNPAGVNINGRFKDDNFSPEATISWHPTRNTTLYAAYKTGYKSGGFSNPSILSAGQTISDLSFQPEEAKGGEIGAKGKFINNRLTLNAALYNYKFTGLQLTSFNAAAVAFSIRNAAAARTKGVEVDASFIVNDNLTVRGAVGYNRARYLSFDGAPCYTAETAGQGCVGGVQNLSNTSLVRAPELNISGGGTYDTPLNGTMNLGLSVDGKYTSGYWMQENQNPLGFQKGFFLLNASVRLHETDDRWELALIGKNLTNRYYGVGSQDKTFAPTNEVTVSMGRTREVAVQGTFRF